MKNLKKRLPVLILAFLIAVMPLAMAVPVNANSDVLDGPSSSLSSLSFIFDSIVFPFPDSISSSGSFFVWKYEDQYRLYDCSSVVVSSVYRDSPSLYVSFSGSKVPRYIFSEGAWVPYGSFSSPIGGGVDSIGLYGVDNSLVDSSATDYVSFISVVSPPSASVGVFSVFSGVSSWLAGAVNNMIPMFWTAEAGLTAIGVLTVCSLALAVILLLFWFIAGWLKFK